MRISEILESMSAGGTGAGSMASVPAPLVSMQKRKPGAEKQGVYAESDQEGWVCSRCDSPVEAGETCCVPGYTGPEKVKEDGGDFPSEQSHASNNVNLLKKMIMLQRSGANKNPIKVAAASFSRDEPALGDLETLGLASKARTRSLWGDDGGDIHWSINDDANVVISVQGKIKKPGDSWTWER